MQRKSCWPLVWHKDGAMLMANKELKSQTMLIIHRLCGVMPCASWHADEISRSKDFDHTVDLTGLHHAPWSAFACGLQRPTKFQMVAVTSSKGPKGLKGA